MARAALEVDPLAKAFFREATGDPDKEPIPLTMSPEDFFRQIQTGQLDEVPDG